MRGSSNAGSNHQLLRLGQFRSFRHQVTQNGLRQTERIIDTSQLLPPSGFPGNIAYPKLSTLTGHRSTRWCPTLCNYFAQGRACGNTCALMPLKNLSINSASIAVVSNSSFFRQHLINWPFWCAMHSRMLWHPPKTFVHGQKKYFEDATLVGPRLRSHGITRKFWRCCAQRDVSEMTHNSVQCAQEILQFVQSWNSGKSCTITTSCVAF